MGCSGCGQKFQPSAPTAQVVTPVRKIKSPVPEGQLGVVGGYPITRKRPTNGPGLPEKELVKKEE